MLRNGQDMQKYVWFTDICSALFLGRKVLVLRHGKRVRYFMFCDKNKFLKYRKLTYFWDSFIRNF